MSLAPSFVPFAIMTLVLALNLLGLWSWSGAVRGKTKTAINEEDSVAFKAELKPDHPPEVARVLRAHANAQANIFPFLFVALLSVLLGGGARFAWIVFGTFTVARILHSFMYLAGRQPWRTIMFTIGALAMLVLTGEVVYLMVRVV